MYPPVCSTNYIPELKKDMCDKCRKSAEIHMEYSKTHLCGRHFSELFEKRVLKTNREFRMIRKGERVAIGLSGGKDSTVLAYSLQKLRKKMPFEMFAITVDGGIPCDYWGRTMEIAKKTAKELEMEHIIVSFKEEIGGTLDEIVESTGTENPCGPCAIIRRRILNRVSREMKADKLAIGHTLDDAVQTILLNMMRNEPMRMVRFNEHLVDIPGFVPRVKPLIRHLEYEIITYGKVNGIEIAEKSCCPYSRYAMRKKIRAMVDEMERKFPGCLFKMFNSFVRMQEMMKKGISERERKVSFCASCGEACSSEICKFCHLEREFEGGRGCR